MDGLSDADKGWKCYHCRPGPVVSLHLLLSGNITLFTELCEKTRKEAFDMMVAHAEEIGANAVIGVRYDATEVMGGVNEVLCYGTAVIVEPV